MRLMLDAHISGPRVGEALESMCHSVRAVDQERELERLSDELLFDLAVEENRIMVTQNVKDFMQILKQRPPEKGHWGLLLIPHSVKLNDFGTLISGIHKTLSGLSQGEWVDRVVWMSRVGRS
jgi:uncharacterized protein YjiS (DUF1127 family)